jgi:hypothetical protein
MEIFQDYLDAQLRLRSRLAHSVIDTRWRMIERVIVKYFESRHVQIVEISGAPSINIVRHFEAEEAITTHQSLEELAQHLAAELAHVD